MRPCGFSARRPATAVGSDGEACRARPLVLIRHGVVPRDDRPGRLGLLAHERFEAPGALTLMSSARDATSIEEKIPSVTSRWAPDTAISLRREPKNPILQTQISPPTATQRALKNPSASSRRNPETQKQFPLSKPSLGW
ncbi:hypothetical protein FocnCong_v013382 [Fusarium oxysporum f. sp. conglutinans]|nr:hypothetical protein FocnCong_v013382 [Fusarium oxysporum f. sp. conglutinans]